MKDDTIKVRVKKTSNIAVQITDLGISKSIVGSCMSL